MKVAVCLVSLDHDFRVPSNTPKGRPGMSDVTCRSRISGLSFDSSFPSPVFKKIKHYHFFILCGKFGSQEQHYPFLLCLVFYFRVSKQWYGCQCLGFLTCTQMLTCAIAHRACMDTTRESAPKVDFGRNIPCCDRDPNLHHFLTYPGVGGGAGYHQITHPQMHCDSCPHHCFNNSSTF